MGGNQILNKMLKIHNINVYNITSEFDISLIFFSQA